MTTAAPTTVPPTTLAPTTLAPTTAVPTTAVPTTAGPTTVPPTTPVPIVIPVDPIVVTLSVRFSLVTLFPGGPVNPALDQQFFVLPIELNLSVEGIYFDQWISCGPIELDIAIEGTFVLGVTVTEGLIELDLSIKSFAIIVEATKCGWVKWSKIGRLDFTIDESNLAGERPMDWRGCVYKIIKLGNKVVVYGENGVTVMKAHDVHYGIQTIHRLGILGRNAAVGNDDIHHFIDVTGTLYSLTEQELKKRNYLEFLENMSNPVMSMDSEKRLIYICDGASGYIYNYESESFGEGPENISGIGNQDGSIYVVADGNVETPKFEIVTDIYDMGTRKPKTIQSLEIGTNLGDKLQARISYRVSNREGFRHSNWAIINPSGLAFIHCYGREFKFHIRSFELEFFEVDYIKVNGIVHEYTYLDTLTANRRGL